MFHFLLLLTSMLGGVGGAICVCTRGIHRVLKIVFNAFICSMFPTLLLL